MSRMSAEQACLSVLPITSFNELDMACNECRPQLDSLGKLKLPEMPFLPAKTARPLCKLKLWAEVFDRAPIPTPAATRTSTPAQPPLKAVEDSLPPGFQPASAGACSGLAHWAHPDSRRFLHELLCSGCLVIPHGNPSRILFCCVIHLYCMPGNTM